MKKPDCCSIDRSRARFLLNVGQRPRRAVAARSLRRRRAGAIRDRGDERRHPRRRPDSGARQARDLLAHARRDLARRHVRLQADARAHARPGPAAVRARDAAPVDDVGRPIGVSDRRPVAAVQAARRERRVGQRLPAVHRRDRRRALLRQEHAHRARQSRPGVEVPAHGLPARGPAVGRRLGQLRARLGQSRPAELRRHELRRLARRAAGRRDLGAGLPAVASSRRRVPRRRRPGAVRQQPGRHRPQRPPRDARLAREARDAAARGVERSRDPVAREPVRDGLPHAELGARGRGHLRRAESVLADVRPRRRRSPARSRAIA